MLMDFHHLIMDGFGYASVLERELSFFLKGKERAADCTFFEIAENESDYFGSEEYQAARTYFVNNFQGIEFTGLSNVSSALGRLVTHTEAIDKQQVDEWCSAHHVDAQSLFQAAFALALGRMARTDEPAYCTSYHARVNRKMMRTQGMFVNNVALKANLLPGNTVMDLLGAVNENTETAYSMGRYPFTHLNRELGVVPRVSFNFRPFRQSLKINGKKYPATELGRDLAQTDINVHIENAGDNYEICVESSDAVNSLETVALFAGAITAALRNMMEKPDASLREIALVGKEDALRLLELSTGEQKAYDTSKIWLDHFKEQTVLHGERTAVVDSTGQYTYAQLDARSDSVARYLMDHEVLPDDFVAIKTGRTKDFMAAVLGVWKAGAAYIPIDTDYPEERISYMLSDSSAKLLLEDETILEAEKTEAGEIVCLAAPSSHAYMIYTSGSTGQPKGVVICQSAMLNLVSFIRDRWGHTMESRIACHSNFSFDASVEDLYPVLMTGGTLYIVPEEVRRDLLLMRAYIRENGITGGCYTTQFGQLLGDVEEPLELDYIVLGGEKMTSVPNITGTVYNTYGPTEFTVDATYCVVEEQDEYADIPIGRALYNCMALVLDSCGNMLPQGAVGELCLCGPQVAKGYWNLPEKTQDSFPTVEFPDGTCRRIYRTGDLVRYNRDDQLEYLGRLDFQIKLHGFRIELGEIDTRAMAFEGVRQAVSQVKQERIVLYYVADRALEENELKDFLAQTLAEYMVPSIYMPLEELPMTANGKVNLKALPEPKLQDVEFTAPETELEAQILRIVKNVLGFQDIGTTTNLVSSGMSSLDTMRLNAALAKEFGSSFMISEILKAPTVRGIAELEEQYTGAGSALQHYSERSKYPITENQRGVYLDWEMNSETTQYNMPGVYVFRDIDPQVLAGDLAEVLNAHSYLKMRLTKEAGVIMQQSHNEEQPQITVESLDAEPDKAFFQKLVKPFNLLSDRLYRVNIYTWQDKTWLFMDVHHLVCDGLSFGVLFDDLVAVMKGGKPTQEQVTAYDYALYEEEVLSGSAIRLAQEYFGELIGDAQSVSYPDSETPDQNPNGYVEYTVEQKPIDDFCRAHEVTPGSFLQAAFALVLKRLSREERPLYLTVSNGRSDARLANTVGMFVKTLPAVYAGGDSTETAAAYVENTFRQLQEIYSREMIPYTWLSDQYKLHAEIMFSYQGGISDEVEGATGISLAMDKAKFPIMVTVLPENGHYRISLEYDGMRYSKTDMQQLSCAVGTAALSLAQVEKLRDVKLVDETEAAKLLHLGAGDPLERDESETILTLLQKRVAATPDAPAVVFHDKTLTYREVDEITNRLAVYLQKTWQIGPEENIGVLIDRSELMMLYPFAIMKTGAAYMPLDPHFPTERLTFMCEDAAVRLILSEGTMLEEKLPEYAGARFKREELSALPEVTAEEVAALPGPQAHNRLVIIFTSGTTGKPKAVDLEHYGVVNFCYWYVKEFELTPSDRVAGYANFGFDAHMIDLYPSVMAGCAVYIFDEAMRLDILAMNDYMEENGISVAFMTTQIGCLISEINHSLRYLSTGGEKMPPVTPPDFRFLNVYGPTECSLFSTYYDVPGYFEGKLIGRPLTNYQLYVIDQANQLVPRGAQGELLISGQGVARGYMNRPELTADKFIDFKPLPSSVA
ncbi:MAG: amino acid adenylation domain-containing protein, partial [Lachnospiraceae bacterium]|nr:amino acid adenylation domain-containing protein [Lachnospiraceae bacterium]